VNTGAIRRETGGFFWERRAFAIVWSQREGAGWSGQAASKLPRRPRTAESLRAGREGGEGRSGNDSANDAWLGQTVEATCPDQPAPSTVLRFVIRAGIEGRGRRHQYCVIPTRQAGIHLASFSECVSLLLPGRCSFAASKRGVQTARKMRSQALVQVMRCLQSGGDDDHVAGVHGLRGQVADFHQSRAFKDHVAFHRVTQGMPGRGASRFDPGAGQGCGRVMVAVGEFGDETSFPEVVFALRIVLFDAAAAWLTSI
jgi:hypothetical protein